MVWFDCRYPEYESATQEYWYTRAVLVAWPKMGRLERAEHIGISALLSLLEQTLQDGSWWRDDSQVQPLQPDPAQPQQPEADAQPASQLQAAAAQQAAGNSAAKHSITDTSAAAEASADAECTVLLAGDHPSQPSAKRQRTESATEHSPSTAARQPLDTVAAQAEVAAPASAAQQRPSQANEADTQHMHKLGALTAVVNSIDRELEALISKRDGETYADGHTSHHTRASFNFPLTAWQVCLTLCIPACICVPYDGCNYVCGALL